MMSQIKRLHFYIGVFLPVFLFGLNWEGMTLSNIVVGKSAQYTFNFNSNQIIPGSSVIKIEFESEDFNYSGLSSATLSPFSGTVTVTGISNDIVTLTLSGGANISPSTSVTLRLVEVQNLTKTGNYNFTIRLEKTDGTGIDQGTRSYPFFPDVLDHFEILDEPVSVTAGQSFDSETPKIRVIAYDQYDNPKTNYVWANFRWGSSEAGAQLPGVSDNPAVAGDEAQFAGSKFTFYKSPQQQLRVFDNINPANQFYSNYIIVKSGSLFDFDITVDNLTPFAGIAQTLRVTNAVDQYGNPWNGSVAVNVQSGGGSNPGFPGPTIPVNIAVSNGSGLNNSLVFAKATPTILSANADGILRSTEIIDVQNGALNDFSIQSDKTNPRAGEVFALSALNARDAWGNTWTGSLTVSANQGNSPDGTPPSLNNVFVINGSGTANQILTRVVQTTLTATSNGHSKNVVINVKPGDLFEFTISNNVPAIATAGIAFPNYIQISVTAYDPFGNRKTDYTGPVTWTSTGTVTMPVDNNSSAWSNGQRNFQGDAFTLFGSGTRYLTVQDGSVSKQSTAIVVAPDLLYSYNLNCGITQRAGRAFWLSVANAVDAWGNPWSGEVTISSNAQDSPNSVPPTLNNISVNNGTGKQKQILVKAAPPNIYIHGQADGRQRQVDNIVVLPDSVLALIKIRNAGGNLGDEVTASNLAVSEHITLFAAGYDLYGNYRQDEKANWTSTSGLAPSVAGQNNINNIIFAPTAPGTGTITAISSDWPLVKDNTGTITVSSGQLHHFTIEEIPNNWIIGQPFFVRIVARDEVENAVSSFTGPVTFSDKTGTITPISTGSFSNGEWTGNVTVGQISQQNQITVMGGGVTTTSTDQFNIVPAPGILLTKFKAVQSDTLTPVVTLTADQTRDWFTKMVVQNLSSVVFRLDSARMVLTGNGVTRKDYQIDYPTVLRGSGTNILAGSATDSLLVRVNTTGHDPGPLTLQCYLYFTNTVTGQQLINNAFTNITVQTPAQISIQQLRLSKQEVTRGQTSPWEATLIVKNWGQSDFKVDSSRLQTYIQFQLGYNWSIGWPVSFTGGDWLLENGETDSLIFSIAQTGDGDVGVCDVTGRVSGMEINTKRQIIQTIQANQPLLIENPPELRITSVVNQAENSPNVNVSQNYSIEMRIQNAGEDALEDVQITLQSSLGISGSIYTQDYFLVSLDGGETKIIQVPARAGTVAYAAEIFQVSAEGVEENTRYSHTSRDPIDDTTRVIIQNPARLEVVSVTPSETQLLGGRVDEWKVRVLVRNPRSQINIGQAAVHLNPPNSSDLKFMLGNENQEDYTVVPPAQLQSGGLRLAGGMTDTLIYRITATGRLGGDIEIQSTITGRDENRNSQALTDNNSATISVTSENKLRVLQTDVQAYHSVSDVAYVNTGQNFEIHVKIENGLGNTIKNVKVVLNSDGQSVSADSTVRWVDELKPSQSAQLVFPFAAYQTSNTGGEIFTASIQSAAYQFSGQPVEAGASIDSSAKVITQTAVELSLAMNLDRESGIYSINQEALVTLHIINLGQSDFDDTGILRIEYPNNYALVSGADTVHVRKRSQVSWRIRTPGNSETAQPLTASWFSRPRDKNSGGFVGVTDFGEVSRNVTTIDHMIMTQMQITSPAGAVDDTLSTEQSFLLRAIIQWNNATNIKSTLTIPSGYKTQDNLVKSVRLNIMNRDTLFWQITAPADASPADTFRIATNGYDAIQTSMPVYGFPANPVITTTVSKADLELSLEITGPADALDGTLALQQKFQIKATVIKYGMADTLGITRVSIDPLPSGYSSTDPLVKTIAGGKAEWTLKAPQVSTGKALKVEAKIVQAPLDENTHQQVVMRKASDTVPVTAESYWLSVAQNPLPNWVINAIVPGQAQVRLMSLSFDNRGRGSNEVQVLGLKFRVEDRFNNEVPANQIFSRLFAVNDEDTTLVYGEALGISSSSDVTVQFSRALTIAVDGYPSISIFGTVSSLSTGEYVQLNLVDGASVTAKDRDSDYQVPVRDETEKEWSNLRSPLKMIYNPEGEMVLWASPNPFGQPGKEETTIRYYLAETGNASLKIYTLIGELVWSLDIPASDPRASTGPHAVVWRALNDQGRKVINGVYLLMLETDQGILAKFKLAVVK